MPCTVPTTLRSKDAQVGVGTTVHSFGRRANVICRISIHFNVFLKKQHIVSSDQFLIAYHGTVNPPKTDLNVESIIRTLGCSLTKGESKYFTGRKYGHCLETDQHDFCRRVSSVRLFSPQWDKRHNVRNLGRYIWPKGPIPKVFASGPHISPSGQKLRFCPP